MQEPTQDNVLIRNEDDGAAVAVAASEEKGPIVYDPSGKNRFVFELRDGGYAYDVAFVFGPIDDDERYLRWLREFRIRGTEENVEEESAEASQRYWDDVIDSVDMDVPEGVDFRTLISRDEKLHSLKDALAVAVVDEAKKADGRFSRTSVGETRTVVTECWSNGEPVRQTHVMRGKTRELEKKYARIEQARFKKENIGGLRRKARVEYVVQDHKLGELYDEMRISVGGFAGEIVPLRFKTAVVHEIFSSEIDQKK